LITSSERVIELVLTESVGSKFLYMCRLRAMESKVLDAVPTDGREMKKWGVVPRGIASMSLNVLQDCYQSGNPCPAHDCLTTGRGELHFHSKSSGFYTFSEVPESTYGSLITGGADLAT
jgi:hypothetical protein